MSRSHLFVGEVFAVSKTRVLIRSSWAIVPTVCRMSAFLLPAIVLSVGCAEQASKQLAEEKSARQAAEQESQKAADRIVQLEAQLKQAESEPAQPAAPVVASNVSADPSAEAPAAPEAVEDGEPVGSVDEQDLLTSQANNSNWLMYGRSYNGHRYSGLKQINKQNVSRLQPAWSFQTGVLDGFECTPLVIDGIMYITTPWNHAYAIDCKTGSQLWHYQKSLPENMALCCDAVNRGFGVWGENLYMSTLDAHLVCLDKNTGEEIWDTAITAYGENGEEEKDIYKLA